jgi:hypothetical protein
MKNHCESYLYAVHTMNKAQTCWNVEPVCTFTTVWSYNRGSKVGSKSFTSPGLLCAAVLKADTAALLTCCTSPITISSLNSIAQINMDLQNE